MLIKHCDFISPTITLYFHGKKRHSSIVSGLITIMSCIFVLIISILFLYDVVFKESPSSFYYQKFINKTETHEISPDNIFHFLTFGIKFKVDTTKIKVIGVKIHHLKFFEEQDFNFDHWLYGSCEEVKDYNISATQRVGDNYFNLNLNSSLCITKFYNSTTQRFHNLGESGFIYPSVTSGIPTDPTLNYGIFIINNSDSPEDILSLGFYSIHFIDNYVNIDEYKNPFVSYFFNFSMGISPHSFSVNHVNFNKLVVRTHDGYFMDKVKQQERLIYKSSEKTLYEDKITQKKIIGSFYFWVQKTAYVHERRYKKIQEALSSIGGLSKIIVTLACFVNKLFVNYVIINDLNSFFDVDTRQKVFQKKRTLVTLGASSQQVVKNNDASKACLFGKKIKFSDFVKHHLKWKRQKIIEWIVDFRNRILSEEKIYKIHLLLKLIKKFWIKKDKERNFGEIKKTDYHLNNSAFVSSDVSVIGFEKEKEKGYLSLKKKI